MHDQLPTVNKGGRPSKYEPEWMIDKVVELMEVGASKYEVAGTLKISFETLNQWSKDPEKKEFSDAIKIGEELSRTWWEREARISLRDEKFNSTLWYMNMKNRFKWADRQENNVEVNGNLSIAEGIAAARKRTGNLSESEDHTG